MGIRDQFFHTMLTQPGKSLLPFSTGLGKKVVPSGLFHKIRFWGTHTNMCSVTQIHSTFNCESVFLNTNLCAFPEHRFYGIGRRLRECCRQSQAEVVSKSSNKIHQTWGPPFSRVHSQMTSVAIGRGIGHILTTGREVALIWY